ncbi:hypothetical protein PHMEG_00024833 [Phytophthora megakarya]|uniref:Reverse transcriptase n=1 Tax=Phytophthora megakarya TaxID=4795 RepID=A0A225VDQ2_9STRA|nr:hypothetical protein PHMEG_00024833 [Phytophthora megakarya]
MTDLQGYTGCENDHIPRSLPTLAEQMAVFKRNIPAPTQMSSVLRRILTISHMKSEFGKLSIPYLSHAISAEGIRATPKIAKGVQDLPLST